MPSETDILSLLKSAPGLKGREVASRLNADKTEVNSALWQLKNRGLTRQDNAYRWFIVDKSAAGNQQTKATSQQATPLGRLCRYYLECLSLDDQGGVSLFAQSNYGLDYVEIPELPGITSERGLTSFDGVDRLFSDCATVRNGKSPILVIPSDCENSVLQRVGRVSWLSPYSSLASATKRCVMGSFQKHRTTSHPSTMR